MLLPFNNCSPIAALLDAKTPPDAVVATQCELFNCMVRSAALAAICSVAVSCTDLTKVSEPGVVQPSALDNAQGAAAYRAGAINRFGLADNLAALYSGVMSDEFTATSGGSQEDMRQLPDPGQNNYPYAALQTARVNALFAVQKLERYSPTPDWQIGEMFALAGYSELLMAEQVCDGVHLSHLVADTPVKGPSLSHASILNQARADFDSALAHASASDSIQYLAQLGLARTLLDMDSISAAQGIAVVPTNYSYMMQYSATSLANQMAQALSFEEFTVSDGEGLNGLNFGSAGDPRVPVVAAGVGSDGVTPLYLPTNDTSQSAPLALATGVEARLIEAEVALQTGHNTLWLNDLNELRADSGDTKVGGLSLLSDPGTDSGRVSLTFRERAFWLFASGHRQGDLRRLIRHYGRAQFAVFPTGPYKDGGSYGSDSTFPFTGESSGSGPECADRNP